MENSVLFNTMSKKDIEVYLTKRQYNNFFFTQFLQWKRKLSLSVETLLSSEGNHVAADIVAFDSRAPEKKRPITSKMLSDIVPIRVKRTMTEKDLNEYFMLMNLADSESKRDAIGMVYKDIDFVYNAVMARLEWMFFQMISHGTMTLSTTTNVGPVTLDTVDFGLPSANKEYIGSAGGTAAATHYWNASAKATNDPIGDIDAIIGEANAAGINPKYLLMDVTKWRLLRQSTAFQNWCKVYISDGTARRTPLNLRDANVALANSDYPQIITFNQRITLENADHTQTSTNPWYDTKYVTFLEDLNVGHMYHVKTAEEQAPAKQVAYYKKNNVLIAKGRETDPVSEKTVGLINAFPAWPSISKAYILNTEGHTAF